MGNKEPEILLYFPLIWECGSFWKDIEVATRNFTYHQGEDIPLVLGKLFSVFT